MNQVLIKRPQLTTEQSGFTLIEILVTVLILAVGSLGIASLHLAGLKYTSGSYARTQAILLADDMANRIKSNREFALDSNGNGGFGATSPYEVAFGATVNATNDCIETTCNEAQLADYDLQDWLAEVQRVMPAGQGQVTVLDRDNPATGESERQFNIAVRWRQVANSTATDGDEADEVKEFTFRISI